jgi:2-isopropylmalate synthase
LRFRAPATGPFLFQAVRSTEEDKTVHQAAGTTTDQTHSAGGTARIRVFDTTLRDGEQSPGAAMDRARKLAVAAALAELGVDVLEAGFPAASDDDFEAVRAIARAFGDGGGGATPPVVCALARAQNGDIDRAADAIADADSARRRLHVFLATSPIHRRHKLRMTPAEIVERVRSSVARARGRAADVEFSAEDATRTEPDFLAEVFEAAIAAGATTVNVPDTVGWAVPGQYGALLRHLRARVRGIDGVVISAHCHDDLGLAVANSLAAIEAGARQVECTVNGIGERAGNCALEELVMALRTRADVFAFTTGVDARRLCAVSRLVERASGIAVQRHKAVVGRNAFAHEAGIHQHGMLRHPGTYEILRPEDVGSAGSELVLGKHSGRAALAARVASLSGADAAGDLDLDRLFVAFKTLADHTKEIDDDELRRLIQRQRRAPRARPSRRRRTEEAVR